MKFNSKGPRRVRALGDAKMHHGQSRWKRNTQKVCKKQVNFSKTGREICQSRKRK